MGSAMEMDKRTIDRYEHYEKPGIVIDYVVGAHRIREGWAVGLDAEGLLVPIANAECFVGIAAGGHAGNEEPVELEEVNRRHMVGVTTTGTFVFAFKGWPPTLADLQRQVWAFDETTVAGAPFRTEVVVGRIVGIERTCDGIMGVRVKIDEAASRCLPPLPGRVGGEAA